MKGNLMSTSYTKAVRARKMVDRFYNSKLDHSKFNIAQLIRTDLSIRIRTAILASQMLREFKPSERSKAVTLVVGFARNEAWKRTFPNAPVPLGDVED
jgi:hypothetical protein